MRILQIDHPKDLKKIMRDIRVDGYGIKIMVPKAINYLIKINSLSNISANILKQEMLSLGGDVAIARDALTGRSKATDCLLMASLSQLNRLRSKLDKQPFGLGVLAKQLSSVLLNYQKKNFVFDLEGYKLNLNQRASLMGIVNLTSDSFSGDGLYPTTVSKIVEFVEKMVDDGADIIDIGGESTRPGARPVPLKEELSRTIPIIKKVAPKIKVPISIDTYKPEVAKQALDNGAVMINDITGLRSSRMVKIASQYKATVVIMHMQGAPLTMQKNPAYSSLIDEIIEYLDKAIKRAVAQGINRSKIIIDPGIGFGKTLGHNLLILNNLKEFKILGCPIMVGPSRKSFLGKILKADLQERLLGTVASCVLAVKNGANIVRVHDVKQVKEALKVVNAITQAGRSG